MIWIGIEARTYSDGEEIRNMCEGRRHTLNVTCSLTPHLAPQLLASPLVIPNELVDVLNARVSAQKGDVHDALGIILVDEHMFFECTITVIEEEMVWLWRRLSIAPHNVRVEPLDINRQRTNALRVIDWRRGTCLRLFENANRQLIHKVLGVDLELLFETVV